MLGLIGYFAVLITIKIIEFAIIGTIKLIIILFKLIWWLITAIVGCITCSVSNTSHRSEKKKPHNTHLNKKSAKRDDLKWIDELEELDAILDD